MSNEPEILNVIRDKRKSMSNGQKKIAYYLLKHKEKAAFLTAMELGKINSCSFCRLYWIVWISQIAEKTSGNDSRQNSFNG